MVGPTRSSSVAATAAEEGDAGGGDQLPSQFGTDLEQLGDVLLRATMVTDDRSGLGLVGAQAGDLAPRARLEVADLLSQRGDVLIASGFAGGDRFPIGEVALHRLQDGALFLACQFSTSFAASA